MSIGLRRTAFLLVVGALVALKIAAPAAADPATTVHVPYLASVTTNLSAVGAAGAVISGCPAAPPAPNLITVSCVVGASSFAVTGVGYDPASTSIPLTLTVSPTGQTATLPLSLMLVLDRPAPPTAKSFSYAFPVEKGTPTFLPLSAFNGALTCPGCSGSAPTFTAGAVSPSAAGTWSAVQDLAQGVLKFSPAPDFTGTVTLSYQIADPFGGLSSAATVTAQVVAPLSTAPIAVPDAFATSSHTPVSGNLLKNDTDPAGLSLTVIGCDKPGGGSVTCAANGAMTYIPAAGYSGTDQFGYHVVNSKGDQASGTVVIAVAKPGAAVTVPIVISGLTDPRTQLASAGTAHAATPQLAGMFSSLNTALIDVTGGAQQLGGAHPGGSLATTGSPVLPIVEWGVGLLLAGSAFVALGYRRHHAAAER